MGLVSYKNLILIGVFSFKLHIVKTPPSSRWRYGL